MLWLALAACVLDVPVTGTWSFTSETVDVDACGLDDGALSDDAGLFRLYEVDGVVFIDLEDAEDIPCELKGRDASCERVFEVDAGALLVDASLTWWVDATFPRPGRVRGTLGTDVACEGALCPAAEALTGLTAGCETRVRFEAVRLGP